MTTSRRSPGRQPATTLALALALALVPAGWGCSRDNQAQPSALSQARESYLDGDLAKGRQLYEDYLKDGQPGQARESREEAFHRLALISGVTARARTTDVLEAAVGDFADDPEKLASFLPELARTFESDRQYARAAEALARYCEIEVLSPQDQIAGMLRQARDLRRLKKMPQAKELLDRCLDTAPRLADAQAAATASACLGERALISAMENQWTTAARDLEKLAADERSRTPETLFALAEAYENSDRRTEAVRIYKDLLPSYPNKPALAVRIEQASK